MKFPLAALLLGLASSSLNEASVAFAFHLPAPGTSAKKAKIAAAAAALTKKKERASCDPSVATESRRAFFSSSSAAAATLAVVLVPWAVQPANAYYYKNGKKVDYFGNEVPMYEKMASVRNTEGGGGLAAAWPREAAKLSRGSDPSGANAADVAGADQENPADVDMEYPGFELRTTAEEPAVDIGPTEGFFPPLQYPPLKSTSIKSGDSTGGGLEGLEASALAAAVVTVPRLLPSNARKSKSPSRRTKKATTAAVAKKAPVNGARVVQRKGNGPTAAVAKKAAAKANAVRVGRQTKKAAARPAAKKAAAPANGARVLQRRGNAGTRAGVVAKKALARVNGSRVGQRKMEPATVLFATKKATGPAPESRRKFFSNSASAIIAAGGTALLFPTEPANAAAVLERSNEETEVC